MSDNAEGSTQLGVLGALADVVQANSEHVIALQNDLAESYPTKAEFDQRINESDRRWRHRFIALALGFLLLFIPTAVQGIVSTINLHKLTELSKSNRALADSNHEILLSIQEATSPEAQKASATAIQNVVKQVDCDQRYQTNETLAAFGIAPVTVPAYCTDFPPIGPIAPAGG